MASPQPPAAEEESGWNGLRRVGGLAFILVAALAITDYAYVTYSGFQFTITAQQVQIPVGFGSPVGVLNSTYFQIGAFSAPSNPDQALRLVAANNGFLLVNLGLGVLEYLALIPAILGLYAVLSRVNRAGSAIGLGFTLAGIFAWISILWIPISYISIANSYTKASSDILRAIYLAEAKALPPAYNFVFYYVANGLLYAAVLIAGFVMLRGPFNRIVAYLGIAAAALGLFLTALSIPDAVTPILFVIWFVAVGYRLWRPKVLSQAATGH